MTIREHRAQQLAVLTGVLVVALAALAAVVQRERSRAHDDALERGHLVYESAGCPRCHSIHGAGSPRAPLDAVGTRLTPAQIEAWIVADPVVAAGLPRSVAARKTDYRALSAADRALLVQWLVARTSERPPPSDVDQE
jgi:hypothetical protein